MYKIIFKTRDTEPLTVSDEKGKRVWELWLDDKRTRIVINDFAFNTVDIKSIRKGEETKAKENHVPKKVMDDYDDFRKKMLSLSLEARSAIMRIPNMVWGSHTQKVMPDEVKVKIQEIQLNYFKENPNCIFTNPSQYQDLIEKKVLSFTQKDSFDSISDVIPVSMLNFVGNIIATDLQYAQRAEVTT